jgi:hypothetical protein
MKSLKDIARELEVCYVTIWLYVKHGELPKGKIAFGKRRFYTPEQVLEIKNSPWIARLKKYDNDQLIVIN